MSETLELMSRDDADELLVAQLGVFLLAAKHSETRTDEAIIQAAIDQREIRLWLLERLGFDDAALQMELLTGSPPLPLFENVGTLLEIVDFLKRYGPELKKAIEAIVQLIQLFKGIAPSVPAGGTTTSDPNPTRVFDF